MELNFRQPNFHALETGEPIYVHKKLYVVVQTVEPIYGQNARKNREAHLCPLRIE